MTLFKKALTVVLCGSLCFGPAFAAPILLEGGLPHSGESPKPAVQFQRIVNAQIQSFLSKAPGPGLANLLGLAVLPDLGRPEGALERESAHALRALLGSKEFVALDRERPVYAKLALRLGEDNLAFLQAAARHIQVLAPSDQPTRAALLRIRKEIGAAGSLSRIAERLDAMFSGSRPNGTQENVPAAPLIVAFEGPARSPSARSPQKSISAAAANREGLRALYNSIVRKSPSPLSGLDQEQQRSLWTAAFTHKVAGLDDPEKLKRYDPTGIIGFCFGRAMAAHLLARAMGLREESIRKLFIIGDLRSRPDSGPEWRFHVTTLVKGTDRRWYAIDPILDGPMTADAWIARVQAGWDRQRKARFYLVPASTVIPDLSVVPDPGKETGERAIEISFDPSKQAGFKGLPTLGRQVYEPDDVAAKKYFKPADIDESGFDFESIVINGEPIPYNGYFRDLLHKTPQAGPELRPKGIMLGLGEPREVAKTGARSLSLPARPPLGLNAARLLRRAP